MNAASQRARLVWRPLGRAPPSLDPGSARCVSAPPPRELRPAALGARRHRTRRRSLDVSGLPGGKAIGAGVGAGTGTGAGAAPRRCRVRRCRTAYRASAWPRSCRRRRLSAPSRAASLARSRPKASMRSSERRARFATSWPRTPTRGPRATAAGRASFGSRRQRAARLRCIARRVANAATAGPSPWTLDVAVTEIGTEGKSEFALRLVTRIALRHRDRADPVWTVSKEVQSETELTTSAWLLAGAGAMRLVLERCVSQAAHELAVDLTRPQSGPAPPPIRAAGARAPATTFPANVLKATAAPDAADRRRLPVRPRPRVTSPGRPFMKPSPPAARHPLVGRSRSSAAAGGDDPPAATAPTHQGPLHRRSSLSATA